MLQKAKIGLLVLLLFVLVRNAGVYHRAIQFNHYVQEQASIIGSHGSLKEILLLKAEQSQLPITGQDINISRNGPELRVSVEYRVPLDLLLFQKELTFHPSGILIN
jgi:hypothetical protein